MPYFFEKTLAKMPKKVYNITICNKTKSHLMCVARWPIKADSDLVSYGRCQN